MGKFFQKMTILFVKIFQIMMERDPLMVYVHSIYTNQTKFANTIAIIGAQLKVVPGTVRVQRIF